MIRRICYDIFRFNSIKSKNISKEKNMEKKYVILGLGLFLSSQIISAPVTIAETSIDFQGNVNVNNSEILSKEADTEKYSKFNQQNESHQENNQSMLEIGQAEDSQEDTLSYEDVTMEHWQEISFGQSTSPQKNYVKYLPNGKINIVAQDGGKITKGHDGITFYYTEIDASKENFTLSADFRINSYGKKPNHDAQESFGIMARDTIGTNGDSSVSSSNMVAIGGFAENGNSPQSIQLVMRKGVTTPTGETGEGLSRKNILLEIPNNQFKLTLIKDNSGFKGILNNGDSEFLFAPENLLNTQDGKMYIGFYAARVADIEISDIKLETRLQSEDPEREEEPEQKVEPNFKLNALTQSGNKYYEMIGQSNVSGKLHVFQNGVEIVNDLSVEKEEKITVPTELFERETSFEVLFYPNQTENITSFEPIVRKLTVEYRIFDGEIFVSPTGTSNQLGDEKHPVDVDTAIAFSRPGQKIILKDGIYQRTNRLEFPKLNAGKLDQFKYFIAENAGKVIFDFGNISEGVVLSGDYWHIKGIDITKTGANYKGFVVGGNNNIVELVKTYYNGDTGLQISRTDNSDSRDDWPKDNLILNCESYGNEDPAHNNADGFAAKLTIGSGNKFYGCISHHNTDDGFDLYNKVETGPSEPVVIEKCIAYANGFSLSGEKLNDGSGFKMGGEGLKVKHLLKDSLTFNNAHFGVSSNSNPQLIVENVVSYNNKTCNFNFATYSNVASEFMVDRIVSFQKDYDGKDQYPENLQSPTNFFFDGIDSKNIENQIVTVDDFESMTLELPYKRDSNGNIDFGLFLKLKSSFYDDEDVFPIYRAYDSGNGDHLYTTNINEYEHVVLLGWSGEGIAFYGSKSGVKIYRLYNPLSGEHFYTKSLEEYNYLERKGWSGEDISFYAPSEEKGIPVYRAYDPKAKGPGTHLFTTSKKEIDYLKRKGWNDEGIAFYTVKV